MDVLTVSVATAARVMNKSEQYVRIGLQRGLLPIGSAMVLAAHGKGKRYTYNIPVGALADYMHLSYEQLQAVLRTIN